MNRINIIFIDEMLRREASREKSGIIFASSIIKNDIPFLQRK